MDTMFTDRLRIKDLEETLANSTALLAVVGAGDYAVEKIRAARVELVSRSTSFDPKAFREQAQATLTDRVEALQTEVQTAPEQLRALPEKAQDWPAKAQSLVADMVATAFSTYGELASRGKTVVSSVRGERGVVEPVAPVSRPTSAVKRAATNTGAKKKTAVSKKSTPTSASKTLAGKTLSADDASVKTPAAKTLASKTTATSTTAAKSLAGKTLASGKQSVKTPAAKSLAAKSTSSSATERVSAPARKASARKSGSAGTKS